MSDKMDDLKNDATKKADDVRDEGEQAFDDARNDSDASIDRLKGSTGEHQDRGGDALAGAKGWFEKIKKSVTGNR